MEEDDGVRMSFITTRRVVGLAALCIAATGLQLLRVERAWNEMLATGAELEAELDRRDTTRPVLRGEPIEGLAYAHYQRAVDSLCDDIQDQWVGYVKARRDDPAHATELRNGLVDQHTAVLEALALGARHTEARPPADWNSSTNRQSLSLLDTRHVANLVVFSAEKHLDEGRADLAVDVLLDGVQFAGDQARSPLLIGRMIGCALLSITTHEALIDGGLLDRIPAAQLERLAAGMRTLDSSLPSTESAWDGEIVAFVRTVVDADSRASGLSLNPTELLAAWRYGFSTRLMCAEYVSDSKRWRDLQTESASWSWSEYRGQYEDFQAELSSEGNGITGVATLHAPGIEETQRGILTLLNMTRCAIEYRLSGEVSPLPDHFGGQLRVSVLDDELLVESLGPNASERKNTRYSMHVSRHGS